MASFKIEGTLFSRGAIEQKNEKFSVLEFVIEEPHDQYPQHIKFQLSNANCNLIDAFKKGDLIEVEFNLHGKKYEKDGKISYFNTLSAWKARLVNSASQPSTQPQTVNASTPVSAPNLLPF